MAKGVKKSGGNYDYTAAARVKRMREGAKQAGGGRVEATLDADELAFVVAMVERGEVKNRNMALKSLVRQALDRATAASKKASDTAAGE